MCGCSKEECHTEQECAVDWKNMFVTIDLRVFSSFFFFLLIRFSDCLKILSCDNSEKTKGKFVCSDDQSKNDLGNCINVTQNYF